MTMKILRISESSESSTNFRLPKNESRIPKCNCFDLFYSLFSRTFYRLGYLVAEYPSYFIIFPIFISILGLTGFQRIKYENDSEYLFSPSDGYTGQTRRTLEELFPSNTSSFFDPSRISRATYFAKVYMSAKDGGTMFRRKIWKDVTHVEDLIQNITVEFDGKLHRYKDLCAKWDNQCFYNTIFNLNKLIPDIEDNKTYISYPIMLFPFTLPMFFGGVDANEEKGILHSAKAVFTTYWLEQDDANQRERAHIWEGKLLDLLQNTEFETIIVDRYTSRSIHDEFTKNSEALFPYLPFVFVLLVGFCVFSVISFDCVRSKFTLALVGVLTVIMAIFTSFGLLMYIGVPYIGINTAAVFLMLGIGLDDMFVILSTWRKTKIQDTVANRMAMTYSSAAISITITSLTNTAAFLVGTFTSFPAVRIFCLYLGVSVAFTYLWFITFFGACLSLAGHQEKNQRHSLCCIKVRSKTESENVGWCYRLFCSGGISKNDPWNTRDNESCFVATFFKEHFAVAINKKVVKAIILFLYILYLGGAIYGCFQIETGLDPKNVALDDSYLRRFYDMENENFRKFPCRIQVIIQGDLMYNEMKTKKDVLQLHRAMENASYVGPRLYTRSWIRGFLAYLKRNPYLRENITDEKSFISVLQKEYMEPYMKESLDVVYNEDKSRIIASRFIIQGYEIPDMEEDRNMIDAIKEVAEKSPLDVSVYHPTFVYYDQYLMISKTTMKAIAVTAVMIMFISFLFIPDYLSSFWVATSIISIQIGVIGYMGLWNVQLDTIAMINLIMCTGFSVDFSAHIVYGYISSFKTNEERLKSALFDMAVPILQSGITTILGVVLFVLVPCYVYRTFFKILFLVTMFGMLHALFILPVLLSLSSHAVHKNEQESKANNSPNKVTCLNVKELKSTIISWAIDGNNGDQLKRQTRDSSLESSNFSRESSLSDSKSVHSESLRSSQGSSGNTSDTEVGAKFNSGSPELRSVEVEHL